MNVSGIGIDILALYLGDIGESVGLGCGNKANVAVLLSFLVSLARELTRNDIVSSSANGEKVEGYCGELSRSSTLKEEDGVVIGNVHKLAQISLCLCDDGLEIL